MRGGARVILVHARPGNLAAAVGCGVRSRSPTPSFSRSRAELERRGVGVRSDRRRSLRDVSPAPKSEGIGGKAEPISASIIARTSFPVGNLSVGGGVGDADERGAGAWSGRTRSRLR